jgi:ribosomal-protein-alanine N-acetyltransferase
MKTDKKVSIERVMGRDNEYIIKDAAGITAGRVFILEMIKEHKYCTLRVKFYRSNSNGEMLKEALAILLRTIFRNNDINKVNVLVDEQVDVSAFVNLGFMLEGILEENVVSNGNYRSELLFGITFNEFDRNHRNTALSIPGKNIELKLLTPEDSTELLNYYLRNKAHLGPYEPLRDESYYTIESQRKIIIEEYKQYLNGSTVNCGIFKDNKLIGKIRLSNIVYGAFKSGILGYSMDKNEQGKGFMKEAVNLMVEYCFEEMDLHRIEASTLVDNIRSQKVLKSCGFNELGLNKKYLYINGGWRDHLTFYKVKEC